jgi:adenine-specific DNA-methyltransferase
MKWDECAGPVGSYEILDPPKEDETPVWPIVTGDDGHETEKRWHRGYKRVTADPEDYRVRRDTTGKINIDFKTRLDDESTPNTWWDKNEYASANYGAAELKDLFGRKPFDFPKAVNLVMDCLRASNLDSGDYVLDYFAGSGTTGHAVIKLNQTEQTRRRFILVDAGEHFDSVIVPRLKKATFVPEWRDGSPRRAANATEIDFSPRLLKIIVLESYEDTLNNLRLHQDVTQAAALDRATETQRDNYLMSYFLDIEASGSASVLDTAQFRKPFDYQLQIATRTVGETKPTTVDLVETFNWLIGLTVKYIDRQKGFVRVSGEKRDGSRTLIIWRTLSDDLVADNEALHKYLDRISVNPADTEFAFIYVNGSCTLEDPHRKIHLIEEEFHLRMFESESFESLS